MRIRATCQYSTKKKKVPTLRERNKTARKNIYICSMCVQILGCHAMNYRSYHSMNSESSYHGQYILTEHGVYI